MSYIIHPNTDLTKPAKREKKKPSSLRFKGKQHGRWQSARKKWFKLNLAEHYTCYLCGIYLTPQETTLDHVIPRSRAPQLRYDMDNLQPCCYKCNSDKGSRAVDKL